MLDDRDAGRLNANDMPNRMPGGKASLVGASVLMSPMKAGLFVPLVFQPVLRSHRIQVCKLSFAPSFTAVLVLNLVALPRDDV